MQITEFPSDFDKAKRFKEIVEHWVSVGLATGPSDEAKCEDAMKRLYEAAGRTAPEKFIWVDSPLAGAYAYTMLTNEKFFGDSVRASVRDSVGASGYGQHDAEGVAYWLTFREIGLALDPKQEAWIDAMRDLTQMGWYWPFEKGVVMSRRPIGNIYRDAQGRLHNEKGPAIEWADGFAIYSFHGTRVPSEIIEHPELITAESVMKEPNSEVRRCMCEMMGWERYIKEAKLQLVDECDDPANAPHTLKLYDVPEQVFNVKVRLLLMVNATPKRDGIVPIYGETVPATCNTALEGAAWQVDVPVEMYSRMARAS